MSGLTLQQIARALGGKVVNSQKRGRYVAAPGPGHSSDDDSMSVFLADNEDGFTVNSFAGDDWPECKNYVRQKLGVPEWRPNGGPSAADHLSHMAEAKAQANGHPHPNGQPPPNEPPKQPNVEPRKPFNDYPLTSRGYHLEKEYNYTTEDDELLYQVLRYEHPEKKKKFLQRSPDGNNGWFFDAGDRKVIYRWPDLKRFVHNTAFVCEGEKDADRLASLGFLATTVASGAWSQEAIEALRGYECFAMEDNDDEGRKKAKKTAEALYGIAESVRIIRLLGLSDAQDVSDWLDAGGDPNGLVELCKGFPVWEPEKKGSDNQPSQGQRGPDGIDIAPTTLKEWLNREFPPLKPLLGELLTTTTRALLSAPTGLGKTNICLQIAIHMAAVIKKRFLCWQCHGPVRVLYIDGEMSGRLFKQRLADAAERLGETPETFFAFSCADIEDFAPLNTKAGQAAVERLIARIGGVDFIFFDSVMCLIDGDMKDEESWKQTLPWIRSLTRRDIGQLWVHHTGHDESHGYGTKTREWQLDVVMLLERIRRDDTDVSFAINFQKARERTPDNRTDFRPVKIWLADNEWRYEIAKSGTGQKVTSETSKFFAALESATIGNSSNKMFGHHAASFVSWQAECAKRGLIDHDKPDSARALMSRHRRRLIAADWIECNDTMAWIIR